MIKILSSNADQYKIEFLNGIELTKAQQTPKYEEFIELMNTINRYKNSFMTIDL